MANEASRTVAWWVRGDDPPSATALSILFSFTRTLARVTRSRGAKWGATADSFQATPGHRQPPSTQLRPHVRRRQDTFRHPPEVPSKQRVAGSNPAGRADLRKLRSWPRGGSPSMTVTGAVATAMTSILRCYTAGTADNSGSAILPGELPWPFRPDHGPSTPS